MKYIFLLSIYILAGCSNNKSDDSAKEQVATITKPDFVVKVLRDEESGTVPETGLTLHNSDYLVKLSDKSEQGVRRAAKMLKEAYCQTYECNITLWDDEAAYNLNHEKKRLFNSPNSPYANMDVDKLAKLEDKWDRKHRNSISEHWISWYPPVTNGDTAIAYYPLVDVTYKELGGRKLMGKDL